MGCASSSDSATKTTASSQSLNASQDQAQNDTSARGDRLMPLPVGSDQTRSTGRDAASGSKRVSIGQKELGNANDGVHQKVLVQAGAVLQRLAEVRSERTTPIYFLRRALEAILMDTSTIYASLQIISEAQDLAVMLVTAGETPSEAFLEVNRAQWLLSGGETGYAASKVCKRLEAALKTTKSSPPPGTSSSSSSPFTPPSDSLNDSTYIDPKALMIGCSREKEKALASSSFASTSSSSQIGSIFSAKPLASVASQATGNQIKEARKKVPVDWQQLITCLPSSLERLVMMPLICKGKVVGALTLGFDSKGSSSEIRPHLVKEGLPFYLHLLCSSLSSVVKDLTTQRYTSILRAVHEVRDLDRMARHVIHHTRSILGHGPTNTSVWFRLALATGSGYAVIFDDPDQFNPLGPPDIPQSGSKGDRSEDDKGRPPLTRHVVALKSSILKLCITNRQQVMIPDVPVFLTQTGRVTSDLYINTDESHTSFQRPASVLVFPLKVGGVLTGGSMTIGLGQGGAEGPSNGVKNGSYGAIFCMSGNLTDFTDVTPKLREICDVISPHILQALTSFGPIGSEYQSTVIQANVEKSSGSNRSLLTGMGSGFVSAQGRRMSQQRSSTATGLNLEQLHGAKDIKVEPLLLASASMRSATSSRDDKSISLILPTLSGGGGGGGLVALSTEGSQVAKSLSGKRNSASYSPLGVTGLPMEQVDSIDHVLLEEDLYKVTGNTEKDEGEAEAEEEEDFDFFSPQDQMLESLLPPSDRAARMVERLANKKKGIKPEDLLLLAADLRDLSRGPRGRQSVLGGQSQVIMSGGSPTLFGSSLSNPSPFANMMKRSGGGPLSRSSYRAQPDMSGFFDKGSVSFRGGENGGGGGGGDPNGNGMQNFNTMPQDVTKALINLLAVEEEEEEDEEEWEDDVGGSVVQGSMVKRQKSSPLDLPEHAARLLKAPTDLVAQCLAKMDEWRFDSFELDRVTDGRPLSVMAFAVLKKCDLVPGRGPLKLNEERLVRFLCKIEDGYPGPHVNPYHCKAHAADVVRSLYVILTKGGVLKALWPKEGQGQGQGRVSHGGGGLNEAPSMDSSPQATMATSISSKGGGNSLSNNNNHNMARSSHEGLARFKLSDIHDLPLLSAIIAATIHDYEHKGFNNDFLIRSGHPLTMLYNDHSPMEQHHLSAAFNVLYSTGANIGSGTSRGSSMTGSMDFIAGFSQKTRASFRKHVIDMVLATDMKQHFNQLSLFLSKLPPLMSLPSGSPSPSPLGSNPINVQAPTAGRYNARGSLVDINENAQSTSSSSPLPHLSISSSPMGEVSSRGTSQRRNAGLKRSSQSFSTRDLPSNYGGGGGGPGAPGGPPSPQPILHNLDDDSRTIALQMSLKCADLGHWSSERSVHRKWVSSLEEEFFRQGDCELQAGLPISPLMDRTKGGVTTSQSGFYSIVLQPQLQAMCSVFPGCTPLFEAAKDNLAMWAEEMGTPSRPTSG